MVKCAECGFLALRSIEEWDLREASPDYRKTGKVPGALNNLVLPLPICFMRVENLQKEAGLGDDSITTETSVQAAARQSGFAADFLNVISRERQCKGYTDWQQGFTPKEHREMLDRQWERKWRIITGIIFVILAGLFTLLGAYIANLN